MTLDTKVEQEGETYTILRVNGNRAIRCDREFDDEKTGKRVCGYLSYNPHDIAYRYCIRCHIFHDDIPQQPWRSEQRSVK